MLSATDTCRYATADRQYILYLLTVYSIQGVIFLPAGTMYRSGIVLYKGTKVLQTTTRIDYR